MDRRKNFSKDLQKFSSGYTAFDVNLPTRLCSNFQLVFSIEVKTATVLTTYPFGIKLPLSNVSYLWATAYRPLISKTNQSPGHTDEFNTRSVRVPHGQTSKARYTHSFFFLHPDIMLAWFMLLLYSGKEFSAKFLMTGSPVLFILLGFSPKI